MGSTSSPDLPTTPFESGMPRLVLQLANLCKGTLAGFSPSLTLLMGNTLFLYPMMKLSVCGAHPYMLPSILQPLLTERIPICMRSQTQMVGSETQRVDYCIGYPQTVAQPCIRMLSL